MALGVLHDRITEADVMDETLVRSSLGRLQAGDRVNLELALRLELPLAAREGPLVEAARKAGMAFA